MKIENHRITNDELIVYLEGVDEPIFFPLEKEFDWFDGPNGQDCKSEVITGLGEPHFWGIPLTISEEFEKKVLALI